MSNAKKIYLTNTEKLFRVNFGWTFFGLVETTSGRQALWQLQCEQKRNAQGGPGLRDVQTYIYIYKYIYIFLVGEVCLVNDRSSDRCSKTPLPLASQRLVAALSKGGGIVLDWVGPWRCWYKHQVDTSWVFLPPVLSTVSLLKQIASLNRIQ